MSICVIPHAVVIDLYFVDVTLFLYSLLIFLTFY